MDLKNKKFILFDLDGTVTDSGPGIMNAATYVLNHFGIIEKDRNKLRRFVGPPLKDSFQEFYGVAEGDEAVEVFREYYADKGVYENELYPHMRELLKALHDAGKILVISSSKLESMVIKVLEHFDILEYFDITVGSTLDESRSEKSEIIEESFFLIDNLINSEKPITEKNGTVRKKVITEDNCNIKSKLSLEEIKNMSVMIGDRVFDVNGAKANGVECIGVTYGYGSREELDDAEQIVDSVVELINLLI